MMGFKNNIDLILKTPWNNWNIVKTFMKYAVGDMSDISLIDVRYISDIPYIFLYC